MLATRTTRATTCAVGRSDQQAYNGFSRPIALTANTPDGFNGWFARGVEMPPVDSDWDLIVYAICADPAAP